MKIGIDLDEVIAEFVKGLLRFYNQNHNPKFSYEDFFSYNLWEVLGLSKEETINLLNQFYNSNLFHNLDLVDGARESIGILSKAHQLYVLTSRPLSIEKITYEFVKRHFPRDFSRVIHTSDAFNNQGRTKAGWCENLGIEIFIEDNHRYALDCAKRGTRVLLMDRPWNKNEESPLERVFSWNEIVNKILYRQNAKIL